MGEQCEFMKWELSIRVGLAPCYRTKSSKGAVRE